MITNRLFKSLLTLPALLLMGQTSRPDFTSALDQLNGSMTEQNRAINELTDADPKIVDLLLLTRLTHNVATNTGNQARNEHQTHTPPLPSVWIGLSAENDLIAQILVKHRAIQAVPAIQAALDAAIKQDADRIDSQLTRSLACSIYLLSSKCPDFFDFETKTPRPFVPRIYEEESMRDILQPHLTPLHGLTALFCLHGKGDQGQFIASDELLILRLDLKNHTNAPLPLDLDPKSFTFQHTQDNQRLSVPSAAFPTPRFAIDSKEIPTPNSVAPNQTLTITWQFPTKDLPLLKEWGTQYHHIRMRYAPAMDTVLKSQWNADALTSNSVVRSYLPQN